jgi:hypothetical protein
MKKAALLLGFLILLMPDGRSQTKKYTSTSGEIIFSFANIKYNGVERNSNLRWSPVFNWQVLRNRDFTQHFGFFHGLAIRNVGFIFDLPHSDTLKKYRTYNLGIPLGIKLGNLDNGFFIYGGYEFEVPINYKEKTFVNERKTDRFNVWFSDRTGWWTQSAFVALNFPGGLNVKFKYYLNNFFNKDFTETVNGVKVQPFRNFDANVFYIAIYWNAFRDIKNYNRRTQRQRVPEATTTYSLLY